MELEIGVVRAIDRTLSLLTRDMYGGRMFKSFRRHEAWKPSNLRRSDVDNHADATPYINLLVMYDSKSANFLLFAIALLLQI